MSILKNLASVLSLAATLVAADYPDPNLCTGNCVAIDPAAIRRDDGVYFRFNTFGTIGIYRSSSLTSDWSYMGDAVGSASIIDLPGNTQLWAPDVKKVGSQYILYYSVSTSGSRDSAIGYATSSTMEFGSWTDHGSTGIETTDDDDYNAIDPALFLDPVSNKYYMSFGSYWTGIYVVEMNDAATTVASGATYTNIAQQPSGDKSYEGSYIIYRDNWYYLFISSGNSGSFDVNNLPAAGAEYKVVVCRSSSVTGPYVGEDGSSCTDGGATVVLGSHGVVYAPGGQGFFDDPTYGTIMYYHYANTSYSYDKAHFQFGWNRVGWDSNGWPIFTNCKSQTHMLIWSSTNRCTQKLPPYLSLPE